MITYAPFWDTLNKSNESSYSLINKYNFSPSVITRLKNNQPITTKTLNELCNVLNCDIYEIISFTPDGVDEMYLNYFYNYFIDEGKVSTKKIDRFACEISDIIFYTTEQKDVASAVYRFISLVVHYLYLQCNMEDVRIDSIFSLLEDEINDPFYKSEQLTSFQTLMWNSGDEHTSIFYLVRYYLEKKNCMPKEINQWLDDAFESYFKSRNIDYSLIRNISTSKKERYNTKLTKQQREIKKKITNTNEM